MCSILAEMGFPKLGAFWGSPYRCVEYFGVYSRVPLFQDTTNSRVAYFIVMEMFSLSGLLANA